MDGKFGNPEAAIPSEILGFPTNQGAATRLLTFHRRESNFLKKYRRDSLTTRSESLQSGPRTVGTARGQFFMKKNIHPKYNPVVFIDMTTGARIVTSSTKTSDRKEVIDGVEHYLITVGITSDSHPFFTGQKQFVDTEGRIDKFQKRFGTQARRSAKPKL
jgi:large subunit ribosomal protein L31